MEDQNYTKSKSFVMLCISILLIVFVFGSAVCIPLLHIRTKWVAILPAMLLLTGPVSIIGFILGIIEKTAKPVLRWIGLMGNGLIAFFWIILLCGAVILNLTDILKAL